MLPDRIGRNDHRKAHQQQDLREAEAIKTALGEALDKRIGADWAFHGSPALAVQGLVYALIDGRNQLPFSLAESESSAREDYLAFIDGEISAVRWRHWRIYPKQIITSSGNPSAHGVYATRAEGTGYPAIFNITPDPREEMNVVGTEAWVIGVYIKIVGAYQASIKAYPNPQGFSLTTFPK